MFFQRQNGIVLLASAGIGACMVVRVVITIHFTTIFMVVIVVVIALVAGVAVAGKKPSRHMRQDQIFGSAVRAVVEFAGGRLEKGSNNFQIVQD